MRPSAVGVISGLEDRGQRDRRDAHTPPWKSLLKNQRSRFRVPKAHEPERKYWNGHGRLITNYPSKASYLYKMEQRQNWTVCIMSMKISGLSQIHTLMAFAQ
jgi:hypothetical protein